MGEYFRYRSTMESVKVASGCWLAAAHCEFGPPTGEFAHSLGRLCYVNSHR